jgi:hypothetical protein
MAPRKKKQTNPSLENGEELSPLSKVEQNNIEQTIAQAYSRYRDEIAADKKHKIKELNHFAATAEEYLNCYLLIGFSLQNEKVILQSISNPKDEAALMDLLRSTFMDFLGNRL